MLSQLLLLFKFLLLPISSFFLGNWLLGTLLISGSSVDATTTRVIIKKTVEKSGEPVILRTSRGDPDEGRTCGQLITSRGFHFEDHYVTTPDGYRLHLYRLINPYAQSALGVNNMKPIVLQHGFLFSCAAWLINSPGETIQHWVDNEQPKTEGNNLAYLLSNLGYDVWLTNNRGNSYSRNHSFYNPDKDSEFWSFSIDQIIDYDTPTTIDYIRHVTGKVSLGYIAHSTGTTQILGLLSLKPHYSMWVKPVILLSPMGFLKNMKGILGSIASDPALWELTSFYRGEFLRAGDLESLTKLVCDVPMYVGLCENELSLVYGPDSPQLNTTRLGVYLNHMSGTSWQNVLHIFQTKLYDQFRRFDYGVLQNQAKYRSQTPPKYPWHKINSKYIALLSGRNDYLACPADIQQLRKTLKVQPMADHVIEDNEWNHLDFIYAKEAYKYVNKVIVEIVEKIMGKPKPLVKRKISTNRSRRRSLRQPWNNFPALNGNGMGFFYQFPYGSPFWAWKYFQNPGHTRHRRITIKRKLEDC